MDMRSRQKWILAGATWLLTLASTPGNAEAAPRAPLADGIIVYKSRRELVVIANGHPLRTIRQIQLGGDPLGPKHSQGDHRTPEGRYLIDYGKDDSAYHLALHISYPSTEDRAFAQANGQPVGGAIYIHGQPNDWPRGRVPGDWTEGCIALTNAEIEALWAIVPDGTPIEIRP